MVSVEYLGEGVGYSIVQAQMLVAGLWGIFWYREVKGWQYIIGWFVCASMTITGIVLLSYQHR
jgi:glucose uptake protein GlcU